MSAMGPWAIMAVWSVFAFVLIGTVWILMRMFDQVPARTCLGCLAVYPPPATFCEPCQRPLAINPRWPYCSSCMRSLAPGAAFCDRCGGVAGTIWH